MMRASLSAGSEGEGWDWCFWDLSICGNFLNLSVFRFPVGAQTANARLAVSELYASINIVNRIVREACLDRLS